MVLSKEIQAFYTHYAPQDEYLKLRYDLLSTIVYASVRINVDGSLNRPYGYNPDNLISYAHSNGIKVVLMFGILGDTIVDSFLSNPTARTTAINNLLNEMYVHNFDGLDHDTEYGKEINSIIGTTNKELMTEFQRELADKLWTENPSYRISIDIPMYPTMGNGYIFDYTVLQNYCNYMMPMMYIGSTIQGNARPISAIVNTCSVNRDIMSGLREYYKLIDKKNILLGVPYFGFEWPTMNDTACAVTTGIGVQFRYDEKIDIINNDSQYIKRWNDAWKTPWYVRKEGSRWCQGHYDNVRSLGIKYDLANSSGLKGIGIWAIDYGTERNELWKLIRYKFGTKK